MFELIRQTLSSVVVPWLWWLLERAVDEPKVYQYI